MEISINKCRYQVDIYGEGKYSLLLIHGFPLDKSLWKIQAQKLAKYIKVVAFDLRGMGSSKCDLNGFQFTDFAIDINQIVKTLRLKNLILLGHSMGGYVAMEYMKLFPSYIRGMVLMSTKDCPDDKAKKELRTYLAKRIMSSDGMDELTESQLGSLALQSDKDKSRVISSMLKHNTHNISKILISLTKRGSYKDVLESLDIPALILVGNCDFDMYDHAIRMSKYNKLFSLEVIDDAGHMIFLERPGEFNKKILSFLANNKFVS